MNIEQFTARVVESAAAAQKAARHLSSLDEMAEKDEYVHSPDLNVSKKKKGNMGFQSSSSISDDVVGPAELPAAVEDLSARFVSVISMAARPSPSRSASAVAGSTSSTMKEEIRIAQANLIPSVAAVYEQQRKNKATAQDQEQQRKKKATAQEQHQKQQQKSKEDPKQNSQNPKANPIDEKHALLLQQLDYDSNSDSSDDEQSIDSQSHNNPLNEMDVCSHQSASSTNSKDPNRFMKMAEDLENEREALILKNAMVSKTSALSKEYCNDGRGSGLWGIDNALETNKALKASLSWLSHQSQNILTKVADASRADGRQSRSNNSTNGPMIPSRQQLYKESVEEDIITMTTSSTFLSADEIAEFEQMRSKNSHSVIATVGTSILEAINKNQHLAFVAFTLLLSLFAYYYSRKRSVDDVL